MGLRFSTEAEYQAFQATRSARAQTGPQAAPEPVAEPQKRRGRMNKLEQAFQREVLEPRQHLGGITKFWFEGIKFRLADTAYYTPDFCVMPADPREGIEVYEVKGHRYAAGIVRLKVAAETYPFKFYLCRKIKGEWVIERV